MGLLNKEKDIKGQKHILAYITPGEADTLQDLGAEEVLTSGGIPAYPPPGEKGGGGYMGDVSDTTRDVTSEYTGGDGVQPSVGDGSYADEEAKALSYAVDAPMEIEENTFIDNIIENYKKAEIPLRTASVIMSPDPLSMAYNFYQLNKAKNEKQAAYDAYIASLPTGEDALGGGDYVEDVQEYSERVYDTDYSALDTESQSELDDAYARQYNLEYYNPIRDLTDTQKEEYLTGTLDEGTQQIINDLIPYASSVIGGSELPPSVFDQFFSDIGQSRQKIMDRYALAKTKTNEFITTPLTNASYGIFEDARRKGLI